MSTSTPHIIQSSTIDHWCYLNQGNKSITYTYHCNINNNVNNKYHNKVLKLNKDIIHKLSTHSISYSSAYQSLSDDVIYHKQLYQLIHQNTINCIELCIIESNLVKQLLRRCTTNLDVTQLNNVTQYIPVILMNDATVLHDINHTTINNTLCIELKPKWLNVQHYNDLPPLMRNSDTPVCRYCMHQHYKQYHNNNHTNNQSINDNTFNYWPTMLLSDDHTAIEHTVHQLLRSDAHNNLHMFIRDQYGTVQHSNNSQFINHIIQSQLQYNNNNQTSHIDIVHYVLTQLLCDKSSQLSQVLSRIRLIQHCFTCCSLHTLNELYKQYYHNNHQHTDINHIRQSDIDLIELMDQSEHIHHECNKHRWHYNNNMTSAHHTIAQSDHVEYSEYDVHDIIRRYMIAKTCKDLSIMITIQFKHSNNISNNIIDNDMNQSIQYDYTVQCIDLDRKLINKIPYYLQQNNEIINCFVNKFELK